MFRGLKECTTGFRRSGWSTDTWDGPVYAGGRVGYTLNALCVHTYTASLSSAFQCRHEYFSRSPIHVLLWPHSHESLTGATAGTSLPFPCQLLCPFDPLGGWKGMVENLRQESEGAQNIPDPSIVFLIVVVLWYRLRYVKMCLSYPSAAYRHCSRHWLSQ